MQEKVRVGLLGCGHLGRIHLQHLESLANIEFVGFFDPDDSHATLANHQSSSKRYLSEQALLDESDALVIAASTTAHYELGKLAILQNKHVFIEKPLCATLGQARELQRLLLERNLIGQVGHVERFNPAFQGFLEAGDIKPLFIEVHRLSSVGTRGADVSVVLDLMIHDLDLILQMVKSPLKQVQATGVSVIHQTPDISNVRLEFENGCVANLTASRISMKRMRKMRVFHNKGYISMDFLDKKSEIITLYQKPEDIPQDIHVMEWEAGDAKRWLEFKIPEPVENFNGIKTELEAFANAIIHQSEPVVSFADGISAMELADKILEDIERRRLEMTDFVFQ